MVYGIIALLALLVDQFLKFWTVSNVALNTGIRPLIPGFLHITYIKNFGAAFGVMSSFGALRRAWVIYPSRMNFARFESGSSVSQSGLSIHDAQTNSLTSCLKYFRKNSFASSMDCLTSSGFIPPPPGI